MIAEADIEKTLKNLKVSKATGLDGIPAKILKLSSNIISPSLTYIFNLLISTGIFVDDWKKAKVIPIVYKSENRKKCENYRPISILPIISKVFVKEVFGQLYQYLISRLILFFLENDNHVYLIVSCRVSHYGNLPTTFWISC